MATHIIVPHLGESVESAMLVAWHRQVGDTVRRGDEIADIETDKAVMPLECPQDGVLLAIMVERGSAVKIGQALALIGTPGERVATPAADAAAPTPAAVSQPADRPIESRSRISPLARRMAREAGIEIASVAPNAAGKISSREIERHLAARPAELIPAAGQSARRVPLNAVRLVTARRMLESAQTIPQFSITLPVNATPLMAFQRALRESGHPATITALLVALTAEAIGAHPPVNASFDGDALLVFDHCNIGVAVAAPDGLRVPVIEHAGQLSVRAIAERLAALSEKARQGRLSPAEVQGGTFTLSNLGMYGVMQFAPLVNPPQAAILGIGRALPVYIPGSDGQPLLIDQMALTLTADHRVLDGADAAAFLQTLAGLIEDTPTSFYKRL